VAGARIRAIGRMVIREVHILRGWQVVAQVVQTWAAAHDALALAILQAVSLALAACLFRLHPSG
jgi:hypothetical protein